MAAEQKPHNVQREAGSAVVKVFTRGTIRATLHPELNNDFFGATGSGAVIVKDTVNDRAVILTNGHVIKDAIVVMITQASWAQKMVHVTPIGVHINRDIALLLLENASQVLGKARWDALRSLELADTRTRDMLITGRAAYIIGHPLGYRGQVITTGTITALQEFMDRIVFQTDISATHGNSGGPCVMSSMQAPGTLELVGMLSYGVPGAGNTTFIITASEIRNVVDVMLSTANRITQPRVAPFLNVEDGFHGLDAMFVPRMQGYVVQRIHPDSPFFNRLQPTDTIVAINGAQVDPDTGQFVVDWADLSFSLHNVFADAVFGEPINLSIRRIDAAAPSIMTRDLHPASQAALARKNTRALTVSVMWNAFTNVAVRERILNLEPNEFETISGITFAELTLNQLKDEEFAKVAPEISMSPRERQTPKLVVLNIDGIIAQSMPSLSAGMLIEKINGTSVQDMHSWRQVFMGIPLEDTVQLQFRHGQQLRTLSMPMIDTVRGSERISKMRNTMVTPAIEMRDMELKLATLAAVNVSARTQQRQLQPQLQPRQRVSVRAQMADVCEADGCDQPTDAQKLFCSRACRMWSSETGHLYYNQT